MTRTRWLDDCGWVSLELALVIGLLIFPALMAVVTIPTWSANTTAARIAAQEAARAYVTAPDPSTGQSRALGIAAVVAENHEIGGAGFDDPVIDGGWGRGETVEVSVTVHMPYVSLFGVAFGAWAWTAEHREQIDRYREL